MRHRHVILIVPLIIFALYVGVCSPSRVLDGFSLRIEDQLNWSRYQAEPRPEELSRITLVPITDTSYAAVGQRWPWDRKFPAETVRRLHAAGARLICLDLVFGGVTNEESDQAVVDALREAGNVLIAGYFDAGEQYVAPLPAIADAARNVGTINRLRGADFKMRRAQLVHANPGHQGQTFAMEVLAAAELLGGRPQVTEDGLQFVDGEGRVLHRIPLRPDGSMRIRYMAREPDLTQVPVHHLLLSDEVPAGRLEGRVAFVGTSGYVFHDQHPTPVGNEPGVMMMVNSLLTMLRNEAGTTVPLLWQWALLIVLGLMVSWATYRLAPGWAIAVCALCLGGFAAASRWLYFHDYLWDYVGVPFMVLGVLSTGMIHRSASLAVESARLRMQATTDGLTGIANLRYLQVRLEHELARIRRYDVPMALLMFDMDGFKGINDKHGHGAGNDMLTGLVDLMKRRLRKADMMARFGGDEFCIILFHTKPENAMVVGEEVRKLVEEHPFQTRAGAFRVTLSIGVAAVDGTSELTWEQLVEQADAALYHSKRQGKNRVAMFHPDMLRDAAFQLTRVAAKRKGTDGA